MYWYVISVKTGREQKVEQLLKNQIDANVFVPFIPLQERIFKAFGTVKKELKPLFPSYVFIESEAHGQEFIRIMNSLLHFPIDILRILKYGDTEIAMRESERRMLLSLCNADRCIESSSGIIVGDRVYITNGPLKGRESIVKKVNRHKKEALIEVAFLGDSRLISVALEIVNKIV